MGEFKTKNFKPKTVFLERSDTQLKTFPVGIDVGFSSVKVMSPNKVAMFPRFAIKKKDRGTMAANTVKEKHIIYTDLETNERWLVGEDALDESGENETSDESLYKKEVMHSEMYRVCLRTGLGIAMMDNSKGQIGNRKLVIQTGFPPNHAKTSSQIFRKEFAKRHHFSLQIGSNPVQEFDFVLKEEDIIITYQPWGTLYSAMITKDHKWINNYDEYMEKSTLVFDPGFGTLDLFPIRNHEVQTSHTYENLGMKAVFQETANKIEEKYGQPVSAFELQKYLENGEITITEGLFDTKMEKFDDLLEEASKKICNEALKQMATDYGVQNIDYFIITGGTGAAWEEQIRDTLKNAGNITILAGNQNERELPYAFANVRGYYMFLWNKMRQEEKKSESEQKG